MRVLTGGSLQPTPGVPSIGLQLVSEGLATCTRSRRDEPRSSEYDALLIAEAEAAVKRKVGIYRTMLYKISSQCF